MRVSFTNLCDHLLQPARYAKNRLLHNNIYRTIERLPLNPPERKEHVFQLAPRIRIDQWENIQQATEGFMGTNLPLTFTPTFNNLDAIGQANIKVWIAVALVLQQFRPPSSIGNIHVTLTSQSHHIEGAPHFCNLHTFRINGREYDWEHVPQQLKSQLTIRAQIHGAHDLEGIELKAS